MDSRSSAAKCLSHLCASSGDVTLHTDVSLTPASDIQIGNRCISITSSNRGSSSPTSSTPSSLPLPSSSSSSHEHSQSASIFIKMSHLISRNPISLTVILCLIVLFVFFAFTFGSSTALAAKSHSSAALIGLFESDFSSKSSIEELDRSKTKENLETDDIYLESPPQPSFNDAEDYDRPETVPVLRQSNEDDDDPPSPTHAKLIDIPVQTRVKPRTEMNHEQVRNFLKYLASKAAATRTNINPIQNINIQEHHQYSRSTESSLLLSSTEPYTAFYNTLTASPRARDLTDSSKRIAQLFQDLRSSSLRISRDDRNSKELAFQAQTTSFCSETLNISTSVEISSPNYPNKYAPNLDCRWDIFAKFDQTLRVQIFKLNLEKDSLCRFDHLDIEGIIKSDKTSNKALLRRKRYCGSYSDLEIPIDSNKVTIFFHSDSNSESNGFFLRVIADSKDCISQFHVLNSTYVTSPKYPNPYGDSKTCWTKITAETNHILFVKFEVLRLEPEALCKLDYVQIYDGKVANESSSLGRYCTQPENASISLHSSGETLLFHFESDNYLSLVGYKARIVALRKDVNLESYANCNWNADWQNMTISSPFYPDRYPPGTECQTSITSSSPEERIIILFDWIDLNDNNNDNNNNDNNNNNNNDNNNDNNNNNNNHHHHHQQQPQQHHQSNVQIGRSEDNFMLNKNINNHRNGCMSDRLEIWESQNDTKPSSVFCGYRNQPFKYVSKSNSIRLVFKSASIDESHDRYRTEELPNNNPGFKARFTFASNKPEIGKTDQNGNSNDNNNELNISLSSLSDDDSEHDDSEQFKPPILLRKPENASVMIGSSHILFCDAARGKNGKRPQIIWFKGDRELHEGVSSDRTSLLIQQFLPSSIGRYICVYGDNSSDAWLTAMNDNDVGMCSSTNVLYRERPKDQYTTEGEFVMLQCSVTESDPLTGEEINTKITWKKMDLSAGGELKPVEFNSRIKILRGGIVFDPALVEDSGFYFCVVNRNETESKNCEIKSAARVKINPRVDVSQYCGRAVMQQKTPDATRRESISDYGKIIGGTEAMPGEFPWMVMFWDDKRHVFCGGALLNERWVMTAAHCFTDATDQSTVFVKLGKNDQTTKEPAEIITKIQDIIKHPSFSKDTFDNDIALIKLQHHITFSDFILPICLPSSSYDVESMKQYFFNESLDFPDMAETRFGYVTGWGRLKESGPLPRFLHKIRLPIVEESRCHEMTTFKVTENMFCAGYGKEIVGDACKGDSGGPFTVLFNNRWTLLGVVSWGEGCGRQEKYGYYTKVNNYISWIRRLTRHTY